MRVDALIFGGGAAGLWLLDELHRAGRSVLLVESDALGAGQTIASQGILHGGIKYTLTGLLSESAKAIREMPAIWRECLRGAQRPDLSAAPVLSEVCYLWRTNALSSRAGIVGAAAGLRSEVARIAAADRPSALAQCPGDVFAVREQVLDVSAVLTALSSPHQKRLLRIGRAGALFTVERPGFVETVHLPHPETTDTLEVKPDVIVLAAGAGNAELRRRLGLDPGTMQRRPLHQVLVRGELPALFGHCVDGAKTRATITSARDSEGRTVWNVGGQIAEDGVRLDEAALIEHACRDLRSILPGVTFSGAEWAAFRVDRAEPATPGGGRPACAFARREGNVITVWPTKLVLAPDLARRALELIPPLRGPGPEPDWPAPAVARPPWETCMTWRRWDRG